MYLTDALKPLSSKGLYFTKIVTLKESLWLKCLSFSAGVWLCKVHSSESWWSSNQWLHIVFLLVIQQWALGSDSILFFRTILLWCLSPFCSPLPWTNCALRTAILESNLLKKGSIKFWLQLLIPVFVDNVSDFLFPTDMWWTVGITLQSLSSTNVYYSLPHQKALKTGKNDCQVSCV